MVSKSNKISSIDEALHATEAEELEQKVMELALERTGSRNGAIFLWDSSANGLSVHFHFVDGLIIKLPGVILRHRQDERPNGIALWVYDNNQPYLCNDTQSDPNYARYFQEVRSVVAVPIPYQRRAMGVISISSWDAQAFNRTHIRELELVAESAAKFLRRAQLSWARGTGKGRPFLIKGLSPAWLEVERQLEQVAPAEVPILVQGESGTGKELVANAVHFNSPRAEKPFVTVNCAAIPETLLESTLFGHTKGAFTGATFERIGEFRKAHRGTLFLDEIGDLPVMLQAKLLRAVEDGEIQPLGSNAPPARVDVRVVCATHHDLTAMVREGNFRDDLYYRLSVFTLQLPPLRDYKNNLELMAQVFLLQAARALKKDIKLISPETLSVLSAYDFPGNVRELKNAMEHAVIMSPGVEVRPEHLPRSFRTGVPVAAPKPQRPGTLRQMRESWIAPKERQYLIDLLGECRGNVSEVSRRAGVNPVTIYRLLKKHGISLKREFTG